jgi:hypothetical protein
MSFLYEQSVFWKYAGVEWNTFSTLVNNLQMKFMFFFAIRNKLWLFYNTFSYCSVLKRLFRYLMNVCVYII